MVTMNFIDIQIEMLKEYKKAEKKGSKLRGLWEISDCGNLMISSNGYSAFVIPKERIIIDPGKITNHTNRFKEILKDDGAELAELTDEIRERKIIGGYPYRLKKGIVRVFKNINGEKLFVNGNFVKPFEKEWNITYKAIPEKHYYSPVFVYQNDEMIGMMLPIAIDK